MHVTLRQLKVFETVARHGSFTRAAEELFLSQPTVSMQVKQLAEAVEQPLFEQVGKKIHLTDIGEELFRTCKELFAAWDRFEMTAADLKGLKRGKLRVACVTTGKYFVPRLLGPFCDRYPGVEVQLDVATREAIIERLARNDDDLYVMDSPPQHFDLEQHAFLDNPLIAIAPIKHPLASKSRIPLETFAAERLLMRERGSGTRMATERFFRERGVELQTKMEIGSNEAIKQAVAAGLGVTVMSKWAFSLDAMHTQIAVLDVQEFPIRQSWFLVHPGGKTLSVIAKAFFDYAMSEGREQLQAIVPDSGRTLRVVA